MGIKWCQLPCQAGSNVLQWWVSECIRVRGQRLQQEKAHARVASDYKAPLTAARGKEREARWDVEESWRITKGRQNEPKTIRCTESDWGGEDRFKQRKEIKSKRRQKSEEWRGNGVKMERFQFHPFHLPSQLNFRTHILKGSCGCSSCIIRYYNKYWYHSINNTIMVASFTLILVAFLNLRTYFSKAKLPELCSGSHRMYFSIHKSYCLCILEVRSVPIIGPIWPVLQSHSQLSVCIAYIVMVTYKLASFTSWNYI